MTNVQKLDVNEPILIGRSVEEVFTKILLAGYTSENYLAVGREIPHLNLRPREVLGLCLLSYLGKHLTNENWLPATDPWGKDGAVVVSRNMHIGLITEQVYVAGHSKGTSTAEVLKAVRKKERPESADAKGINLIVFVDRDGGLDVHKVAKQVQASPFEAIYLFGLANPRKFEYFVAILKSPTDPLSAYKISIDHKTGLASIVKH